MEEERKKSQPTPMEWFIKKMKLQSQERSTSVRFKVDKAVNDIPAMLFYAYQQEVESRGRRFVDDDATREHVMKAAKWMVSADTRFGLLLYGTTGNGKTTLAKAMQTVINILYDSPYRDNTIGVTAVSALKLADMAKDDNQQFRRIRNADLLHIDDVGCEPASIRVWGNELSPLVDILYHRYDEQLYTVITSNLSLEDIFERYGYRIGDRFYEMFDTIAFEGKSYRRG